MRVSEILKRYAEGQRDFRRLNIRGKSFQGQELLGADFSEADLRGTNFRGAILNGTKFVGAKAGLQKRSVIGLLIVCFLLEVIASTLLAFATMQASFSFHIYKNHLVECWISLIIFSLVWLIIIRQGIEARAFAFAVAFPLAGFVAFFVLAHTLSADDSLTQTLAMVSNFALIFTFAVVFAFAAAFPVAVAFAVAGVGAAAVVFTIPIVITAQFSFSTATAFFSKTTFYSPVEWRAKTVALTFAGASTLINLELCFYISWLAMKVNDKYRLIRSMAVAMATFGGTCFRDAQLINANFTNATLKSTDFRGAVLTKTCWKNVKKLDRVRLGKVISHPINHL